MSMYKEVSSREASYPQRRRTPSFSSTLLDAIYRSIDESNGGGDGGGGGGRGVGVEEKVAMSSQYREATHMKKQSNSVSSIKNGAFIQQDQRQASSLRQAVMKESWMEKKTIRRSKHYNSASSSSDSSYGGGTMFSSSSEAEDSRRSSSFTPQRAKPIADKQQKPKLKEGGFTKTKLRALKIYGELKKVKQPISPGGRIASFLNSIFSSGGAKKVKMCSMGAMEDVGFERKSKSTCSSVSSFSRSCLSKTPPSRPKQNSNGATKRSVRFYPVSVIVDEDSRPCGHKCIYEDDPGLMPMPQKIFKSSLKEEAAKGADFLRNYQKKKDRNEFRIRRFQGYVEEEDDSDEDDDESCSSSDLFELDHLIGIGRYREELPVYETTNFRTNQAIANGFIL